MTCSEKLVGILGYPVSHSLSPKLHNYWLELYKLKGNYVFLPVTIENMPTKLAGLKAKGFVGINVTVPYKETILPLLDEVSDIANFIGAVNTVFITDNGHLRGTNTDAEGFIKNLNHYGHKLDISGAPSAVLGSGGAARAVAAALVNAGSPEIRVIARNKEKAARIKAQLGDRVVVGDWVRRSEFLLECGLLVNATTLGMTGQQELNICLDRLPVTAVVNDLVYSPLQTQLLERAHSRGNAAVDGLGMLLYQAVAGFEGWFGVTPIVDLSIRDYLISSR